MGRVCSFGLLIQFISCVAANQNCGTDGAVRLTAVENSTSATVPEGRVEVCYSGEWGTVCDDNWGPPDAKVVCRQLGLPTEYAEALYAYGGGSGLIHYAGFWCRGNESHLVNCSVDFAGVEVIHCRHFEDAGVRCPSDPCTENEVQLNNGVVEVCHDAQWGLVCVHRYSWNLRAAEVVCSQVGIPSRNPRALRTNIMFYSDVPVILNDTLCYESSERLTDCTRNGYGNFSNCSYIAVAYCEAREPCSDPEAIQLARYVSDRSGRLEVCSGGYWGTVCGIGATDTIANIACRQLNHAASGTLYVQSNFTAILRVIPIARTNVVCNGNENTLSECRYSGVDGNPDCNHDYDILISCNERQCNETDIRLVDGQSSEDGRVLVCLDGVWGSVCDDRWDYRDAAVVCRQLGYNGSSYALLEHSSYNKLLSIHLDDVACYGNESKLSECRHRGIGFENCAEGLEEAGVICTDVTCENGRVHLVGGDAISRGRVEYCHDGSWYSVCASDLDEEGARVVCNTLGYDTTAVSVVSNFGRGTSQILSQSIQCTRDDSIFSNCSITMRDTSQCQHVAGVICEAPCLSNGCTTCGGPNCAMQYCYCHSDCYEHGDCCPDVAHVENCVVVECDEGEVRLVGGVTNSSGRLEVCANGVWGRVCNAFQYWGPDNARVVCRQLGFSEQGASVVSARIFGAGSTPFVVGEVHCTGTETELLECSHSSIGYHFCKDLTEDANDVAIVCAGCEAGEARLRGGIDPSNGRVEVCQFTTWGAVCNDEWDDNDARVVCRQLGYNPEDARAVQVFGREDVAAFFSGVRCTGSEKMLTACSFGGTGDDGCTSAGVTCGKSTNVGRCMDESGTPTSTQTIVMDERLGKCVAYTGGVEVCDGVLRPALDYIYIPNNHGTQSNISTILNSKIQGSHQFFTNHDKFCVDQVFRVMCRYYLPPCGNFELTHTLPPSSICQEECSQVQSECHETWQTAAVLLTPYPFINCDDTSRLLFPLPNCCTGAGITSGTGEEASGSVVPTPTLIVDVDFGHQRSGVSGGTVAGVVISTLAVFVLVVIAVVVLLVISRKLRRSKRLERMQWDILALPGRNVQGVANPVYDAPTACTRPREFEPDNKDSPMLAANVNVANPNPYLVPRPATESLASGNTPHSSDHSCGRVNSRYMRELSFGRFIIKFENITQLDNIGQGEFGIVYRAKLGPHGREVAVKTLKGDFDQLDVDRFVEESLKMSRFRHAHVMGLIGVCLDAGSAPYIVMPYMANGSLLKYLKKERKNIVFTEDADEDDVQEVRKRLMVMCSQIASGMEYLASQKYIHRDLAARNCMIDSHFLIKITDFGLSEDVFVRNYFRQGAGGEVVKLPVKWMAPESLSDGHFSEKSDVWSYGVTMWEIFSGGKAPFPGADPLTLIQRLEEGDRMPKPYNSACSEKIYAMMMKCWETVPDDRPTFKELCKNTNTYIERIAGYLEMGFNPFAGGERVKSAVEKDGEEMSEVAIQVIPASVQNDAAHSTFTD